MLTLECKDLELRGIANKTSQNNKVYYILYVENVEGKPYNFYCPDASALPQGLKKGDTVNVSFDLSYYKGQERLTVSKVSKAV